MKRQMRRKIAVLVAAFTACGMLYMPAAVYAQEELPEEAEVLQEELPEEAEVLPTVSGIDREQVPTVSGIDLELEPEEETLTDRPAFAAIGITEGRLELNEENFPDEAFRNCLESTFAALVVTDDTISAYPFFAASSLSQVTAIAAEGLGITSLAGLEYFPALTSLRCGNNLLTALDVSKFTQLTELSCHGNRLTSLDLRNNKLLVASKLSLKNNAPGFTVTGMAGSTAEDYCTANNIPFKAISTMPHLNGFVNGPQGWGIYKNGLIDKSVTGLKKNVNGAWMYVNKGKADFSFTGLVSNEHGWWHVEKGTVTFRYNGVSRNVNGLWFIKDSKVDFSVNGLVKCGNGWYSFKGGKVDEGFTGLMKNANGWWYVSKGQVDFNYNGVVKNEHGWWCVQKGGISFSYNGVARNANGLWYIRNSKVDFGVNGVVRAANGVWYYFNGGKVQEGYNGLQKNANGWWYIDKGQVRFNHNGLVKNEYGWWYVQNSGITFAWNGLARNEHGLWFVRNSKVDFGVNGVVKAANGIWYYFQGGKVQEGYNGIAKNANGWWHIVKGQVDFSKSVPGRNGSVTINNVFYTYNSNGTSTARPAGAMLNVRTFGALPNDGVDDTSAIRNAIAAIGSGEYASYKTVYIPGGTYNINAAAGGIRISRSNVDIVMDAGTVLQANATTSNGYSVFSMEGVSNISITGGIIQGDRLTHTAPENPGGPSGMGILAYNTKNLLVSNMTIRNCWADGITLAAGFSSANGKTTVANCNNVRILNCTIHNNRRDNISITGADNVVIDGCSIYDANGSANQVGVLIEPFVMKNTAFGVNTYVPCKNITISDTSINAFQNKKATQVPGRQFFTFATYLIDTATQAQINASNNKINYSSENVTISKCTINGDLANYSGRGMKIFDSTIYGTIEYLFGIDIRNTKYTTLRKY